MHVQKLRSCQEVVWLYLNDNHLSQICAANPPSCTQESTPCCGHLHQVSRAQRTHNWNMLSRIPVRCFQVWGSVRKADLSRMEKKRFWWNVAAVSQPLHCTVTSFNSLSSPASWDSLLSKCPETALDRGVVGYCSTSASPTVWQEKMPHLQVWWQSWRCLSWSVVHNIKEKFKQRTKQGLSPNLRRVPTTSSTKDRLSS